MSTNPLTKYFRTPALYLKLPTLNQWYTSEDIELTNTELPVYGLSAVDDIMLNTPDALLNGHALEQVISNCAPNIKNVKNLLIPDLEAIFVAMKIATNEGKMEIDRTCPKCKHENTFDLNCNHLLDSMLYVEEADTQVVFEDNLIVHIKPYTFSMRQMYLQKEFEQQKLLESQLAADLDEFQRSAVYSEGIKRMTDVTFDLVSQSITRVHIVKENIAVEEHDFIVEWLTHISKPQADAVMDAVAKLNSIGINKKLDVTCEECGHTWEDTVNFDPTSFFGKRS